MTETLGADEVRYRLDERWKRLGFDALLPEERDFILVWWLEAEANNGGLHQYFWNSTGDAAIETFAALERLGASHAARVMQNAISLLGGDKYPTDRKARQASLEAVKDLGVWDRLTDRLFEGLEPVIQIALDRVGDAFVRDGVPEEVASARPALRVGAIAMLYLLLAALVGVIVLAVRGNG